MGLEDSMIHAPAPPPAPEEAALPLVTPPEDKEQTKTKSFHPEASTKDYGRAPTGIWTINRIYNAIAVWSLLIFWIWLAVYWILQFVPMPLTHMPGSKTDNEYKYDTFVIKPISKAMCPRDPMSGSPISYCVWYFPAFISFTIVAVCVRLHQVIPHRPTFLAGDMDYILFSYVAIALPLLIFFCFYMYKKWPTQTLHDTLEAGEPASVYYADVAGTFANRLGFVGFWFLTFFMIPASRHGPVLAALGWHPYHACTIHMFCGWGAFYASWAHFLCYIIKYWVTDYADQDPNVNGMMYIIAPPKMCWTWNTKTNGQVNTTTGEPMVDDDAFQPMAPVGYQNCGKMLSGFFGTVSIAFFTLLVLTSLQVVRRYKYQVFYFSHILCAPLFVLFVSMHWSLTYQYTWPSLFYYFATQAPFLLQHSRKTINNFGLKITGVMDIPCRQTPKDESQRQKAPAPPPKRSLLARIFYPDAVDWLDEQVNRRGPQDKSIEHCVSFSFAVTDEGFAQFYPGMYGNIWCPDASLKSHPFSVTHVPGRTDQLRIIFRVFGKWTDLLARSLIQLPSPGHQQEFLPIPKIMLDGWHGPNHLVGSVFNHDKAIIVTAGIGITAFLSMLTELIEILCFNEDGMFLKMDDIQGVPVTKEFALHWTCRDENLIKYITDEYFQPLMEKAKRKSDRMASGRPIVPCTIHIHRTGPAGQKTLNPTALWMTFRDKTERGVVPIDYGLLGTFGTPWSPYRFSFGRWDSLMKHFPSIAVFCSILWASYFFTIKVHFWIKNNPFGLPRAVQYASRITSFIPTIFVAFSIGWLAHIMMDWTENVHAKSKKSRSDYLGLTKTDEYDEEDDMYHSDRDFTKSLMTPETSDDNSGSDDIDDGWEGHFESNMIALHTTAGRPPFDDLIAASYEQDYASTAIYLCGPEMMISSCKKAVGMSCQLSAQRLQMALKKNKFVFYEEKFEW